MLSKIKTTILALVMMITTAMAQSPSMINYQGVARDLAGSPIANQNIKVRLKVHSNTANGAVQYSETRLVTTSSNGLFNIQIGSPGTVSKSGSFDAITWGSGTKFLQVEMDPTGGTSFINMGTQQMVSVPYALYSNVAGALKFPFYASDSSASVMFDIENKNSAALRGTSTASSGVVGISQNGNGVFGMSSSPTVAAVAGVNTSGGQGVRGISQLNHGISGESQSASYAGVYGFNPVGYGVRGYTTSTTAGVQGEAFSQGGTGVYGVSNSATSKGVFGFSSSGIGVKGFATDGTGVEAGSLNGYALKTSGKVQISGGNTNPGNGKILTSDSAGNATWQGAVAFKATGLLYANATVGAFYTETAEFENEVYDLGNNYNTALKSFTAPVNGIYHFDAQLTGLLGSGDDFVISLVRNRSGVLSSMGKGDIQTGVTGTMPNSISVDLQAQSGDVYYITIYQGGSSDLDMWTTNSTDAERNWFSGHLVVKL